MQNFVDAYSWINLRYLLQGLGVTLEVSIASIFFQLRPWGYFGLGTLCQD